MLVGLDEWPHLDPLNEMLHEMLEDHDIVVEMNGLIRGWEGSQIGLQHVNEAIRLVRPDRHQSLRPDLEVVVQNEDEGVGHLLDRLGNNIAQSSKIRKKVQFHKYKNTFFAISNMATNLFLQQNI